MEAITIIGLTALAGYFFKERNPRIAPLRNVSENDPERTQPVFNLNEQPVSSNIYNSNMVESANTEVLERSIKNYRDAQNPSMTGVLPPIYNSYSVIGSDKKFVGDISIQTLADINNTNRLADVSTNYKAPTLENRPMFNQYGLERVDNEKKYINFGSDYTDKQVSLLTGLPLETQHDNMVPFFGGTLTQNIETFNNESVLDKYTGNTSTFFHKKEAAPLFEKYQQDINGTPLITNQIEMDRFIPSAFRQNEKPFYEERVAAPIAFTVENPVTDGAVAFKTIDELRVASKPQISYEARKNSGKFGDLQTVRPNVNKNRVDTSFELGHKRVFTGPGAVVAPKVNEDFETNFQPTSRQSQNIEYYGVAVDKQLQNRQRISAMDNSQDLFDSLMTDPKRQNLNTENEFTRNIQNENLNPFADDFNKDSFRKVTQQRESTNAEHKLNANQSDRGQKVHLQDSAKGTIKQTTLKNRIADGSISTQFNKGKGSSYQAGMTDISAKVTNKQTTVKNNYNGHVNKKDGMGYTVAKYRAKTTNKETTSKNNYHGHAAKQVGENENRNMYENAEITEKKEVLLSNSRPNGRKSTLGSISAGKNLIGDTKTTKNMLLKEEDNTRIENVKLPSNIPSKAQIGQVQFNINRNETDDMFSLKDTENNRFNGDLVKAQLKDNPFYNLR